MTSDLAELRLPRSAPRPDDPPQAPPALAAAPRLDPPAPAADAADGGTSPRMEFRLSGDRMGAWQRAWATAQHLFQVGRRRFSDARAQEGGMLAAALRWRGPSVEDQAGYARSRAWTPTGHAGGLLEAMGVIFHAVIGRAAAALGNAIKWVFCWPLHAVATAVAGSAAWWGLHAALGLPGGTLPLIVTGIALGAWVAAALFMTMVADHRQGAPSRWPAEDNDRDDGAWPGSNDDEDYV